MPAIDTNMELGAEHPSTNAVNHSVPLTLHEPSTTRPGNLFTEKISQEYHNNSETGYYIPLTTFGAPENRRLKVITIGAGCSGIMLAHNIERDCENVEHVIYEKNSEVGGTWTQNRYPNCACDVPSAAYQLNFAMDPDWPKYYSGAKSIRTYLNRVVDKLDLRKFINFNSKVIGARFDAKRGTWTVKIHQTLADGTSKEIENECDLLLGAIGLLDRWTLPNIPGIEKFKGRVVHTAGWPADYQEDQWKDQRVVIIGSGASAIQTVPGMQPYAKKVDVFARTPTWFFELPSFDGVTRKQSYEYSEDSKKLFREDHDAMVKHAKGIDNENMKVFPIMLRYGEGQKQARERMEARMKTMIKDERLLKGFTPSWSVGCRRITPGDPFMEAIQKPNVNVHFTGVASITEDEVIGDNGVRTQCDTIVCATGFDVSYRPPFPLVGLNGVDLRDKWEKFPEGYFGVACPDIPNYLLYLGPTWPVQNGSIMGPLNSVINYTVKIIQKMQHENIKYWVPKQSATDSFNDHVQTWMKGSVWEEDCNAWYKDSKTRKVRSLWPGSALHYMDAIKEPRYEDFDIQYHNQKNKYAYLGLGFTVRDFDAPDADRSPHLDRKFLDPRYYK